MDYLTAIVLAVVEGVTEFLPVSSTGHLILAATLLKITQIPFVKSFELSIQSGAILAVVLLYWRVFLKMEVLKRIIVAFIPTGVVGLLIYHTFKDVLLGNLQIVLWSLFLGGVFLILFEWRYKELSRVDDVAKIPYKHCFLIGLIQAIAVIPGVSRSAPTILGGLALGMKRETIVLFSFLLAVPTMIAASGYDLLNSYAEFSSGQIDVLLVGFVVSFLVALPAVKLFLNFVKKNDFIPFGVYRVVIVALFFFLFVL